MLFNSSVFCGFFILVFGLYWSLGSRYRTQNLLLLAASYFFYGCWDWRFLSLLAVSTTVDFVVGRLLHGEKDQVRRKRLLAVSVVVNLSILGFFKYFDFFAQSTVQLLAQFGLKADFATMSIILPIGISFYTFQTMSYTIDIYRRRLAPTRSFVDFALFVAFFPQLVAGPIERAANLLPQIGARRTLTASRLDSGIFLIIWGYFKKVVVADNLGSIADQVFGAHARHAGIDIPLGVVAFSMQIYGDFSGYSDIARGLARVLGFELMVNFKLPYFARNPSDFWRRWHISLSTWLRDYLYIPLGGGRGTRARTQFNLAITMLLGGLWHGAAWNFLIWGAYHGVLLSVHRWFSGAAARRDQASSDRAGLAGYLASIGGMWLCTMLGWLIFRAATPSQIIGMLRGTGFGLTAQSADFAYKILFFSVPVVAMQIAQHLSGDMLVVARLRPWQKAPLYAFCIVWICVFGSRESMEFIYFQF